MLGSWEGDLKEVEERSAAGKTALEKQISLQETLTNLQKDKADEAMKKITSLQVRASSQGLRVRGARSYSILYVPQWACAERRVCMNFACISV